MNINEMEVKVRELRQLQLLIEEAQAEAEAIKDSLKAAMGDSEAVQAGSAGLHGNPLPRPEWTQRPPRGHCPM